MINGPELWDEILSIAREVGTNPIIAGGAVRDFVLKIGTPKDIDVFITGSPPDDMQLPPGWMEQPRNIGDLGEYAGQIGTITAIQDWRCEGLVDRVIQFIWIGGNDSVHYVRGFDLGLSKCYYRGSTVLGKDFMKDWERHEISILDVARRNPNIARERARRLLLRVPFYTIIEPNVDRIVPVGWD